MKQLISYLNFNGQTSAAMDFYKDCIGGELTLQTIGEAPFAGQMPPEVHGHVLHSTLVSGPVTIMGSDMVKDGLVAGNNVSLMVECSSAEETQQLFDRLSAGGQVRDPLGDKFWGGLFGALTDKYGIHWSLHFARCGQ